ncbi:calcium-activated potassium channel alpha chain [Anaeramoeba flamelloides]|uniref:Calcium-activated potassium channel alpha chain n=1 Tax=Anaeramoeba flamelloides TaxID=1746091 RepID=A0AAV8ABZ7_9EUKA|nr:calcium-activated potassium channel alpha chain [Anaeramoeba flamelloides]
MLNILIVCATWYRYIENLNGVPLGGSEISFHDSLYYMVVTCTTVGYGDISPISPQGRYLMICVILFIIVVIPIELGDLTTLLKDTSILTSFTPPRGTLYFVLCGDIFHSQLKAFLVSIFSKIPEKLHIVILNRKDPTKEILDLIEHPNYKSIVHWVIGNPLNRDSLTKVNLDLCSGVFLFADLFSIHGKEIDTKNLLRLISILDSNPNIPLYIQVLDNDKIKNFEKCNPKTTLPINQIKSWIIAHNTCDFGWTTLISNLISPTTFSKKEEVTDKWKEDYMNGAIQNIYSVLAPQEFIGKKFHSVFQIIYENTHELLLIGLSVKNNIYKDEFEIMINPVDCQISTHCRLLIIAKSEEQIVDELQDWDDSITLKYISQFTFNENIITNEDKILKEVHIVDDKKPSNTSSKSNKAKYKILNKEKNQKINADHFYSLATPSVLSSVKSFKRQKRLREHIIISGMQNKKLFDLILPLRSKLFGSNKPIIITTPKPMLNWDNFAYFPNLFVMENSKKDQINLLKQANIHQADKALLLQSAENIGNLSQDKDLGQLFVDSDSLFAFRSIETKKNKVEILSEIIHPQNLRFLNNFSNLKKKKGKSSKKLQPNFSRFLKVMNQEINTFSYQLNPYFCSSMVFSPTLLDTLFSLAYTDPDILQLILKLIFGPIYKSNNRDDEDGDGDGDDDDDDDDDNLAEGNKKKRKGKNKTDNLQTIFKIPIPSNWWNLEPRYGDGDAIKWREIVNLLHKQFHLIAIAISRKSPINVKNAPPKPYIITNPDKEFHTRKSDQIFVIGNKTLIEKYNLKKKKEKKNVNNLDDSSDEQDLNELSYSSSSELSSSTSSTDQDHSSDTGLNNKNSTIRRNKLLTENFKIIDNKNN